MLEIGNIVTPKEAFTANGFYFKIVGVERQPMGNYLYKLKNIEQDKCHTIKELNEIKVVEATTWEENELDYLFDTCVQGNSEGITIQGDSCQYTTTLSIDASKITLSANPTNKKEENKMKDILDLYEERKTKLIIDEYSKAEKEVKKEDEIQSIILEMTDQINTILKNQNKKITYEFEPNLITLETEIKIDELKDKRHEELEKLHSTLDEIRALFEMTDDYDERIKILKNYDILDKKGKLSI